MAITTEPYFPIHNSNPDLKLGYEGFQEIYSNIENEIEELLNLDEDWDGEGGMPLLPQVGNTAKIILYQAMENNTPPRWVNWKTPHFSPIYNGGLNLEWNVDGRRLALIINSENEIKVVRRVNGRASKFEVSTFAQILQLISWVMGSQIGQNYARFPQD